MSTLVCATNRVSDGALGNNSGDLNLVRDSTDTERSESLEN